MLFTMLLFQRLCCCFAHRMIVAGDSADNVIHDDRVVVLHD